MDKQKYPDLTNYINGQKVASSGSRWMAVVSPLDGSLLSRVPMSNAADLDAAVQAAATAQAQWAETTTAAVDYRPEPGATTRWVGPPPG